MPSVFYRTKDGKVVRRVYRSVADLDAMLQNVVKGTATTHYTDRELEEMIQKKKDAQLSEALSREEAEARALELAENAPGGGSGLRQSTKAMQTARRIRDECAKYSGGLAGFLPWVGPVVRGVMATAGSVLTTNLAADIEQASLTKAQADLATLRGAYLDYQATLREEWLAQKETKRLWSVCNGQVIRNTDSKTAKEYAELNGIELPDKAAVVAQIQASMPADTEGAARQNEYLQEQIDRLAQENENLREEMAELRARADAANTVTNAKENGLDVLVPVTEEEKEQKADHSTAKVLIASVGTFLATQGLKPQIRQAALALSRDLYNDVVGWKWHASTKLKRQREYERLLAMHDEVKAEEQDTAAKRQKLGQELMDRLEAIRGKVLAAPWNAIHKKVNSWGLMTDKGGETFSTLKRAVEALEGAANNPKSPYHKAQ